jgi:hyaluronan synthase
MPMTLPVPNEEMTPRSPTLPRVRANGVRAVSPEAEVRVPVLPHAPSEPSRESARDPWVWALHAAILGATLLLLYREVSHGVLQSLLELAKMDQRARLLLYPAVLWTLMGAILLAFRTCVWMAYRPFPPCSRREAPPLTVVIPAYNEGAMVWHSIASVAEADYPRERLQIVVVDDGSTDDTWRYIRRAAARYPGLVTALRHPKNRGKREALALGFSRARGEVIVTLDSDSVIERDALLALAGPFRDERIGAVAGKVLVYNRHAGVIPRMLHVRFILSFDLLRAVESAYGNVYCCPGAMTAYRAAVLRRVLEPWRAQTFLGARCTFGEDRALTNFFFEEGYDAVYQRSAVVHTTVPTIYSKLCKMFIRWDRSYVREEIRFVRIVWKRPLRTRLIALYDRSITNLRYPVYYASIALLLIRGIQHPSMLVQLLTAIGVVSLVNGLYYLRSERSLGFLYGVLYAYFSFFALFWIFPYAVATVRARSWLTR